jgi:transcriptional antiterminator NusG
MMDYDDEVLKPEDESSPEDEILSEESIEQDAPPAPVEDFKQPESSPKPAKKPAVSFEDHGDQRAWYVIHCYSGYENKVRHNLEQRIETMGMKDRIFDIIVPTQEEIKVKDGKQKPREIQVFPGYVLVNMILSEESWYVVRNTPGVTGFVGMGNEPTPLRPDEVANILRKMEEAAPQIVAGYKSGDRVHIIDGPFNDFRGVVEDIDQDRAKVTVMVNFFGRDTPVELDFVQVEKA